MVTVGQGRGQLGPDLLHGLRCAAVGDGQIVALVVAAGLDGQIYQLVNDLGTAPDLGHRLQLPVRREGQKGLDFQQSAGGGGNPANAAALPQILQGVHGEEGVGPANQLRHPTLRQFLPAHAGLNILHQLHDGHADTQRAAEGVKYLHLQSQGLLRQQAHHIEGAGKSTGQHHRNDTVISLLCDPLQNVGNIFSGRQRRLGQFARVQALIDIRAVDIHAIQILPVVAEDAQRNNEYRVLLQKLRAQICTGVCQNSNFFREHGQHLQIFKS